MTSERRKDSRFRPVAPLQVVCLDTPMAMTLDDLGAGGFSAVSPKETAVGTQLRFRFSSPAGSWSTTLTAETAHCRREPEATPGVHSFHLGFKFLNAEAPSVAADIRALIDRATAVISVS